MNACSGKIPAKQHSRILIILSFQLRVSLYQPSGLSMCYEMVGCERGGRLHVLSLILLLGMVLTRQGRHVYIESPAFMLLPLRRKFQLFCIGSNHLCF